MSDYIRREDALKAVDDIVCDADDAERTCDRIIDLPSADVVPVVRCKDCKYSRKDELWHMRWCKGLTVKDEHFCADGERKDNE